ncbi:MAG TPA: exopolysaccharide biosynthesis polyprenyl glycosylphosphotransferase [Haliangiales bacterium]|nr:exopolysaccharide biosynthesis polyprenyl glycosylphosphotransferase [Haliangiales bacterium]
MNTTPLDTLLAERFLALRSPLERWRLNGYARLKRVAWRRLTGGTRRIKRAFDAAVSLLLLLLLGPLFLVIALLIKLDDGGPVFFAQTRVGKWGRHFKMFKFRSMYVDAERRLQELLAHNEHRDGVTFKMKKDPRITRIGKWLRRLSLDELPQFINVLWGDMSLVGPRPPVPREVEKYSAAERRRLMATPGITGLWQVGGRAEIDFSGQVQLDVQYIESQTFWGDVTILLKTIPVVLSGRGAY